MSMFRFGVDTLMCDDTSVLCSTLQIREYGRISCECQYHSLDDTAMWSGFRKALVPRGVFLCRGIGEKVLCTA